MSGMGRFRMWMAIIGVAAALLVVPRWLLWLRYSARIHPLESSPHAPVAIVFGAGLRRDGTPTLVLADRVAAAVELYRQGRVDRILLTGSVRGPGYDEAGAMAALAVELGAPAEALWVDTGGVRTASSCQRARDVFGVTQALLVTQAFHLPRALALCDSMGIRAQGVAADLSRYGSRSRRWWELREYPASLVALLESAYQQTTRRPVTAHDA
ncbi:MAG TPA: ElyC/SanA/YdcF family protein [Anaerolineales bacterium]|nr:ElyC/SanA/YdcF family protein [Anaerolineales bacterium]